MTEGNMETDTETSQEIDLTSGPFQFVRVGTWFWRLPEAAGDKSEWLSKLETALRDDTRVEDLVVPKQDPYWVSVGRMYPDAERTTSHGLSSGGDAFRVLQLQRHIAFRVRVPVKNQTSPHGEHEIPSDTYWVAWDGISVFVLWDNEDPYPPLSGGHVVADVLRDVTTSVGADLYVQGCSPSCDFMFTHTPLRLVEDEESLDFELVPDAQSPAVTMRLRYLFEPVENVQMVALLLGGAVESFARFKNVGRRIIDLERACRSDLSHVLSHVHEHATLVAAGRSPRALKNRWRARSWRREARALVASVWLAIANLETLRRQWDAERENMSSSPESGHVFGSDLNRDVTSIERLNLESATVTINQISAAFDSRMLMAATAGGAMAGGLAGGLTGLLG